MEVRRGAWRRGAGLPKLWLRLRRPPPAASGTESWVGPIVRLQLGHRPPGAASRPARGPARPRLPPRTRRGTQSGSAAPASSEPRAQLGADAARAGRRPPERQIRPPGGGGSAGVSGALGSRHRLLGPRRSQTASRRARQTFWRRRGPAEDGRENPTLPNSHLAGTRSPVTAKATSGDLSTFTPTALHTPKCTLLGTRVEKF